MQVQIKETANIFLADAVSLIGGDGAEKFLCFADCFQVQRVIRPFAFVPALDESAPAQ